MTNPIIQANNISKCYRIGAREQGYRSFREAILDALKAPIRNFSRLKKLTKFSEFSGSSFDKSQTESHISNDLIWALKDLSFEVEKGEVLGIIGRNGAGKSTLLKILSRITYPTFGEIRVHGRVSSLLEVGTGFHPELTGRENIYLNGAILGMRKWEINNKFNEIIEFAEIKDFLDTPVKRYSSGMYVRLAFAVAAHLEPEVLLVDEVLAVGDVDFQRKCLGRMGEIRKSGRTILFVSHNMSAIEHLCDKVMLLENGQIAESSENVSRVIDSYLYANKEEIMSSAWENHEGKYKNPWFQPKKFYIGDRKGETLDRPLETQDEAFVYIGGTIDQETSALQVGYALYDEKGMLLYWSCHNDTVMSEWPRMCKGLALIRSKLPSQILNEGVYRLEMICALYCKEWLCKPDKNSPIIYFTMKGRASESPYLVARRPGILVPAIPWERVG